MLKRAPRRADRGASMPDAGRRRMQDRRPPSVANSAARGRPRRAPAPRWSAPRPRSELVQTVLSHAALHPAASFAEPVEDGATAPAHEARQPTDVLTVLATSPTQDDRAGPASRPATPPRREPHRHGRQRELPAPPAEDLPIQDYDSLAASQVVPRLATLSTEDLEAVQRLRVGQPPPPDDPQPRRPAPRRLSRPAAPPPGPPVRTDLRRRPGRARARRARPRWRASTCGRYGAGEMSYSTPRDRTVPAVSRIARRPGRRRTRDRARRLPRRGAWSATRSAAPTARRRRPAPPSVQRALRRPGGPSGRHRHALLGAAACTGPATGDASASTPGAARGPGHQELLRGPFGLVARAITVHRTSGAEP